LLPASDQATAGEWSSSETSTDLGSPTFELVGDPFTRALEGPGLRLKLPAAIAEAIGKVLMVLLLQTSDEKWLAVIPVAQWRAILRERILSETPGAVDRQAYLRRLAADARRVELSRDGRLTLPKELATRCGIKGQVTIFPRLDRLEIVAGKAKLEDVKPHLYHEYQGGVPGLV
jgi:DNA-binding transcriptional regulator/RsmH inhibitor MraZ